MKIRFFLLLIFLQILPRHLAAAEVLARRISVNFQQTPIETALETVARQANFEWSYNPKILAGCSPVNLVVRDWTVRETLREMLGEDFQVKVSGNYLILKKQKPPKNELSGTLRDPKTGERIAGATVYDAKTLRATTTDSSGFYRLKVKKRSEIVVTKLGYRDTTLRVASNSPRFQKIELVPLPPPDTTLRGMKKLEHDLEKTISELEYFFSATLDRFHQFNVRDTLKRQFQFSILPKLGTNHVLDGKVTNDFSVNLIAGQSAGVGKLEVAGAGNFTRKKMGGAQFAGAFNWVRGDAEGAQFAGAFNAVADTLRGVQAAGAVNFASENADFCLQMAGAINISKNGTAPGGQVAGAFNWAREVRGAQVAGAVNSAKTIRGVQAAGAVNRADSARGVQIAGAINHAKTMRGLQIGIFNSAKDLRGLQIGLLNRSGGRVLPFFNW